VLVTTLRPRTRVPRIFVGKLELSSGNEIASFFTETMHPLALEAERRVKDMARRVLGEDSDRVLTELEKDMNSSVVAELSELPLKYVGPTARLAGARHLLLLAMKLLERHVDVAAVRLRVKPMRIAFERPGAVEEISRILWYRPRYIHTYQGGLLYRWGCAEQVDADRESRGASRREEER